MKEFEQQFSDYFKVPYTLAVSSGSAALKLSLQALGIGRGDEVITQSHTFIATVEAICEVGARPVIINVDKSLNMDPTELSKAITVKTKAIIPVHMSGVACKMNEILEEANDERLFVLEDNAQSPGGCYKGQYLGTIGDIGIFSMDGGKMLTTGEGGMILTSNKTLFERARGFSDHGHAENPNVPRGEDDMIGLGFNYKMMELQGAIGQVQLSKLKQIISDHYRNKTKLKIYLKKELDGLIEFREIPNPDGEIGDSITFFLPTKNKAQNFVTEWKNRGLPLKNLPGACRWHFAPNWTHIKMNISKNKKSMIPSKNLIERAVEIPIRGKMTDNDINKIVTNMKEILKGV